MTPTERRVLDATKVCCERWGIAKVTIDDIAAEAGVSRATLYRMFPGGKDVLFDALRVHELEAFFTDGRTGVTGLDGEVASVTAPPLVDGPWPPAPQPAGGWVPGDPIRVSEVVEVLAGCRDVLGIRDVHLRLADGGAWTTAADGELAIPAGTVPVRVGNCFTVDISRSGGCGDA